MSARHGGPAFPAASRNDGDGNASDAFGSLLPPGGEQWYAGMTLRDYFAAKAMAALIAVDPLDSGQAFDDFARECAEAAYVYADAMLKAREA